MRLAGRSFFTDDQGVLHQQTDQWHAVCSNKVIPTPTSMHTIVLDDEDPVDNMKATDTPIAGTCTAGCFPDKHDQRHEAQGGQHDNDH